ncbi:hypothetical protein DAKH74_003390 [Maudiozyma humilis]|uniref:L-lactate dehydrogenase (cytochrome) n=1 Tax=Maudiozyma humilis TaxID=51915 RepID=A0AAV5RR42_MAUHU|nr:hypothetical protein DAKH74_003390 [Kazachstania humilis]
MTAPTTTTVASAPLSSVFNLHEFEVIASKALPEKVYAYYACSADDEVSYRQNHHSWARVFFRPKVLVDVSEIDLRTQMLGQQCRLPFYVSATALCGLGNPAGAECSIARACAQPQWRVPQMVSTFSSDPLAKIAAAVETPQLLWFQLYVGGDRTATAELVAQARALGLSALFVTVDAAQPGNRERDLRFKFSNADTSKGPSVMAAGQTAQGTSGALSKLIDPALSWDDIRALVRDSGLPVILKGVQRVDDALRAAELGCRGVVLSNHGGRQLDFSVPPVEVLADLVPELRKRGITKEQFDVFVDGGIRRGTDVLKALCLGASGVGIASPFLYANSLYGQEGVEHAFDLLVKELVLSMRLLGVTRIEDLNEDLLDLRGLYDRGMPPRGPFHHHDTTFETNARY